MDAGRWKQDLDLTLTWTCMAMAVADFGFSQQKRAGLEEGQVGGRAFGQAGGEGGQ